MESTVERDLQRMNVNPEKSTKQDAPSSKFLTSLPREVRDLIYAFVLSNDSADQTDPPLTFTSPYTGSEELRAVLGVQGQFHFELNPGPLRFSYELNSGHGFPLLDSCQQIRQEVLITMLETRTLHIKPVHRDSSAASIAILDLLLYTRATNIMTHLRKMQLTIKLFGLGDLGFPRRGKFRRCLAKDLIKTRVLLQPWSNLVVSVVFKGDAAIFFPHAAEDYYDPVSHAIEWLREVGDWEVFSNRFRVLPLEIDVTERDEIWATRAPSKHWENLSNWKSELEEIEPLLLAQNSVHR